MKLLILTVCCLAAISSSAASTGSNEVRNKFKYLEAYMAEKQAMNELTTTLEQICPGSKVKFENALNEVITCADKIDETAETSCSIVKNKMPICVEPMVKVIKDCMPEESKEIPKFFVKSFLKGVDYICKTDGEHIFELGNTCVYKQNPTTETCSRKLRMRFTRYSREGLGVNELCSMMEYMRPCLKSHLMLSCGSPITREAILGFADAFSSNCVAIRDASSNESKEIRRPVVSQLEDLS